MVRKMAGWLSKRGVREKVAFCSSAIEIVISVVVLVAIMGSLVALVREAFSMVAGREGSMNFTVFLGYALNMVIGVEFIKMLSKHTPDSAIEVLLYAIARQMIVEHTTALENFIGVAAIALLFVIRKYLFIPSFGEVPADLPASKGESPRKMETSAH